MSSPANSSEIPPPVVKPERSRTHRYWRRFWRVGLGTVLIVFGTLLGLVPGIPGVFFAIAGLALMADEIPIAHRLMLKLKAKTKAAQQRMKRRKL